MNKIKRYFCSCLQCKNEISSNCLGIHYNSKQCKNGSTFHKKWKNSANRSLTCKFCEFIGKNLVSISQHEIRCINNPYRINLQYLNGAKNLKKYIDARSNGLITAENQYTKAKKLNIKPPQMSENGKNRIRQANLKKPKSYSSKESKSVIQKIIDISQYKGNIYCSNINREWFIKEADSIFFYDLTFPDINLIVEYQGIAYHPKSLDDNWKAPFLSMGSKEDVWYKDRLKESLAIKKGFKIIYIWSDDVENGIDKVLNEIGILIS